MKSTISFELHEKLAATLKQMLARVQYHLVNGRWKDDTKFHLVRIENSIGDVRSRLDDLWCALLPATDQITEYIYFARTVIQALRDVQRQKEHEDIPEWIQSERFAFWISHVDLPPESVANRITELIQERESQDLGGRDVPPARIRCDGTEFDLVATA